MIKNNIINKKLKTLSVLVIEDNPADFFLLKKTVEAYDKDTHIFYAECLHDAYQIYKRYHYDLVLLDLNLPDGYGIGTIREVRKFHGNIPLIAVTSLATSQIKINAFKMGADAVVSKDFLGDPKLMDIINMFAQPDETDIGDLPYIAEQNNMTRDLFSERA